MSCSTGDVLSLRILSVFSSDWYVMFYGWCLDYSIFSLSNWYVIFSGDVLPRLMMSIYYVPSNCFFYVFTGVVLFMIIYYVPSNCFFLCFHCCCVVRDHLLCSLYLFFYVFTGVVLFMIIYYVPSNCFFMFSLVLCCSWSFFCSL